MDNKLMTDNQKCFVSMLSRLRESSKDAVVSSDSNLMDSYTMYMHVDRPVQDEFVSILKKPLTQMKLNLFCFVEVLEMESLICFLTAKLYIQK